MDKTNVNDVFGGFVVIFSDVLFLAFVFNEFLNSEKNFGRKIKNVV